MCEGASDEECERWHLEAGSEGFAFLAASGCYHVKGTDDQKEYQVGEEDNGKKRQ